MSHHRGADISCGVKAFDDAAVVAQRTPVHVGPDATLGAQIAWDHLGGVIRCMGEFAEVGIGLVGRVAVVLVVCAFTAVKVFVDT